MWTLLLLAGALMAHGRSPDPYAGCRAEPFSDDGFIHRCPGLVMTEVPSPATTARVALSMVQDHYRGPSGTARETQLTIAGEDFPVVLLERDGAQSLLTALAIPKRGMRVLHCATSGGDEEGLRRCAALAGRAQAYGLGNRSTVHQPPPSSRHRVAQ